MIQWPDGSPSRFDHDRAGWPLVQKHAAARCEKCHVAAFQVSPAASLSTRKTSQGYVGLETTCASCHEDIHRDGLGQECATCHDADVWKTTPGFTHDTTSYPLTGRHAEVSCDQCHRDSRPVSSSCGDCHADPHQGALGAECATCHVTAGFRVIAANRFDHTRTRYPLRGEHRGVTCSGCHNDFSTPRSKRPLFATCTSCHEDDHGGTATVEGWVTDCDACHSVEGFVPSTYTSESHARTTYPLEGKHAAVRCNACHTRSSTAKAATTWGRARVVLRPEAGTCAGCHVDAHGGQLQSAPERGECAGCHQVTGWAPSTWDSTAHSSKSLALTGRHLTVACAACHGASRGGLPPLRVTPLGTAQFAFRLTESDCTSCHIDPHPRELTAGVPGNHGCATCHDARAFRPSTVGVEAHSSFRFPLRGAHRATPCLACHESVTPRLSGMHQSTLVAGGVRFEPVTFDASRECADCHRTPHGAQFDTGKARGDCAACHSEDAFAPASRFDHTRDASFSLVGAHATVSCARCHRLDPTTGTDVYRPLSASCESCHGKAPR